MNEVKILVVDDLQSQLSTLEDILVAENYFVTTADDAAGALRQFANVNPDIVILDVNLPDGNGLTLIPQLKNQPHGKKWLPIMLTTSDATVEDCLAGYRAGCDDYLTKPFDPRILLAKLAVIRRNLQILSA